MKSSDLDLPCPTEDFRLKATLTTKPGKLVLSGQLVFETVVDIWEQAKSHISGKTPITVNLAGVEHCDSAALSLMTAILREAKKSDTKIVFEQIPDQLLAIIHASRLEDALL